MSGVFIVVDSCCDVCDYVFFVVYFLGVGCKSYCWSGDGWCVGGLVCCGGVVLLYFYFVYFMIYGDYFL